jgi:hypothetical protein
VTYTVPPPGRRITNATLRSMVGEWQTYSPSWSASSGTTTLGDGTLTGRYCVIGGVCRFTLRFEWGSSTTQSVAAADWGFSLPVAPYTGDGNTWQPVEAWIQDLSGTTVRWLARGYINSSQTVQTIVVNADGGPIDSAEMPSQTAQGSSTTSVQPGGTTWASGDRLNLYGAYETA